MAVTLSRVKNTEDVWGGKRVIAYDVTGDAAYPTGGYSIPPGSVSLKAILGVIAIGENAAGGAYQQVWNIDTGKLQIFYPTGGGAASPAALADPAVAAGATPVTSAAANGAADLVPGRGKELANNTDASTLKFRLLFMGW